MTYVYLPNKLNWLDLLNTFEDANKCRAGNEDKPIISLDRFSFSKNNDTNENKKTMTNKKLCDDKKLFKAIKLVEGIKYKKIPATIKIIALCFAKNRTIGNTR